MSIYHKTPDGIFKLVKVGLPIPKEDKEIRIKRFLSEKKDEIIEYINTHRRILLTANPASGKTTFFANLCIDHSKNKIAGRIIFCCPFLIIQEQFKESLESKGIQIDYELNHKSLKRKLKEYDKIVTSTFHSFKRLAVSLDENDTVIVDEAHAILFRYKSYENNTYNYFNDFIKSLYKTKSKIVLLTGTPRTALKNILNLMELKVVRKETSSKINIQYTNEKDSNIVLEFANNCLKQFTLNHLNIIYIKNKTKCWLFKELIEASFDVRALVLTADEKDSIAYKELVKNSQIPEGFQFLITTNVISTGANILNKNIGKALMLDETDPIEIKQFSKRFRSKPDIEVDIINPLYKEPEINLVEERYYWLKQREELRTIYQELLNKLTALQAKQTEYSKVESIRFNDLDSSPDQMINLTLDQFLTQEIYFSDQLNFTYNSNDELVNALNKFDDIMSTQVNSYCDINLTNKQIEENILTNQKDKKDELYNSFFNSPKDFLKASHNYLIRQANIYLKYKLENIINLHEFNNKPDNDVETKTNNTYFINHILTPFIEFYPYFDNYEKTIFFLKNTAPNKRTPLKVSIYFNNKFHEFFNIEIKNTKTGLTNLKLKKKQTPTSPTDKFTVQFLKLTFNYLVSNDYINYDDFLIFLLKKEILLPSQLKTPLNFPYDELEFDSKSKVLSFASKSFVNGLSRSIFKLSKKQLYRYDKNKNRKAAYMFTSGFPKNIDEGNIFEGSNLLHEKENSIVYEYSEITNQHDFYNLNNSKRILTNTYGLTNDILDYKYYEMYGETLMKYFL